MYSPWPSEHLLEATGAALPLPLKITGLTYKLNQGVLVWTTVGYIWPLGQVLGTSALGALIEPPKAVRLSSC